jgi:serine/threonine protein kinase
MASLPPFIARYEIKQRLGQGGMGAIYLARDPVIDRLVALKLLHNDVASDDIRKRFAQEARASGALTHPNIVTIYDYGEFGDSPFIVMEYVRGETLADLIRRGAEIPITQKLRWIEQVCNALGYAHGENVVHRDVKPSNLMVDQHGVIKVLDFGIARIVGAGLTKMSMVIGTPGYMSPEQIQGSVIDARSDIFAVGAVLYELLCYREAFAGETPHAVMSKVVGADPIPLQQFLTGADLSIADVVERAMHKIPDARYQSMTAFEVAVRMARMALESQKTDVTILPRGRQPSPPSRRRRTDPVEIARRRAEQIEQHLRDARRARDAADVDAAIAACEAVLLLDPASFDALALLDNLRGDSTTEVDTLFRQARDAIRSGDYDSAERLLGKAAAVQPKATEIRLLRTELLDRRSAQAVQAPVCPQAALPQVPQTPAQAPPPQPAQAMHGSSATFPARPSQNAIDRIHPWEEAVVKTTTPIPMPPTRSGRSPLVWVVSAVVVVTLAVGGWMAGARSAQRLPPSVAGAEPVGGSPSPPPSTAARPTTVTAAPPPTTAPPAAEPVQRSDDALKPAAADDSIRDVPSNDRPQPPARSGRPTMPPAPRLADPGPALRMAEAAESRGDLTQALTHYREALRIDPTNATATRKIARIRASYFLRRAESLLEAGDYDAAQRDAASAIEIDPGSPGAAELLKKIEQARTAEPRKRPPGR